MTEPTPDDPLSALCRILLTLGKAGPVRREIPGVAPMVQDLERALAVGDPECIEAASVPLYSVLHQAGGTYAAAERERLDAGGGYACIAGGFTPLLQAGPFIGTETVSADLGAGNGLQGMLLQRLFPHRQTLQIELSAEMIRVGKIYQQVLGIGDDRMVWVHGDMAEASLDAIDFIYLYRPAKPSAAGEGLYKRLAWKLAAIDHPLVIFSIADCLGPHLDGSFSTLFSDGHLSVFLKK